jgi:simple sugar transport system ATP-binding protein
MSSSTGEEVLPLTEVRGVSKTYGATRALTDVSVTVKPGRTHALVGRNGAGKSTLVSVMTGLTAPDHGSVWFSGQPAPSVRTPGPWQSKVACVYQHRRIVPHLSVAENLLLNRLPRSGMRIDWGQARQQAVDLLSQWNIDIDPRLEASQLSVEDAQLVEIVRALSGGSRFVILDEPTAQLVASGVRRLFKELTRLQASGVTFLYISHHLEEIEELCQDVTVLRNGTVVASDTVEALPTARIVEAMVGGTSGKSRRGDRKGRASSPSKGATTSSSNGTAPALELHDVKIEGVSEPVSLTVAPGEILGIAGHTGSGSREIAEAVFGHRPPRGAYCAMASHSASADPGPPSTRASVSSPRTGIARVTSPCCPSRTTSQHRFCHASGHAAWCPALDGPSSLRTCETA